MKRFILPYLICPACIPREHQLILSADSESDGDIVTGILTCQVCKRRFPIQEGIAHLLPNPGSEPSGGQLRYEEGGMSDRYLWSHYADLLGVQDAVTLSAWSEHLATQSSASLDAGCSVGRVTFELANRSTWAIGCDLSLNFIKTARRLAQGRHITFSLPLEGNLREVFSLELPGSWRTDNLEFIVADVLQMPFAKGSFQQTASLNVLDRVNYPLAHLFEMNRVTREQEASFLFASPFSWGVGNAPENKWLGGKMMGSYSGKGLDNVRSLLEGLDRILVPPWKISQSGNVEWKMRSHSNHHELIRSQFLVAKR